MGNTADGQQGTTGKVVPLPRQGEGIVLLDDEGEIYVLSRRKRKSNFGKGWAAMFPDAIGNMSEMGLTKTEWDVWACMIRYLDYDNWIRFKQKDVAERLHLHRQHVSRAIKRLIALNIVQEGPMMGRSKSYRLNPYIGHKGKNLQKTVIEYDDLRKRRKAREQEQGNEE